MPSHLRLSFQGKKYLDTKITLTGSKSECNRALILSALSNGMVNVRNHSIAADTVTLHTVLNQLDQPATKNEPLTVDIGPAGTAMRFLTAFLPTKKGTFVLTGTERMKQRPIGILTDAMQQIGAHIRSLESPGYPPLLIEGPLKQIKNEINVQGDISSQYISALLMIAPSLPQGLKLNVIGELTSRPYVEMTLEMLKQTGIEHEWTENTLHIRPQSFKASELYIEPDWSAASYWYAIVALSDEARLFLPGLKHNSLQGDRQIASLMRPFGVETDFKTDGVWLYKTKASFDQTLFDLKSCPDLAQTLIVLAAVLRYECQFTGLETLKIKETDRIKALQTELLKIGVQLKEQDQVYHLDCSQLHFPEMTTIATYEDHRMAMAFAPLALVIPELEIEEPEVVHKSYPAFWEDLEKAGFSYQKI